MTKLIDFKSNTKAETEGEWVPVPELGFDEKSGEPVALFVRSIHFPPFKIELAEVNMRLQRQYPGDMVIPPHVVDRENGRLYAKHLLLNWRHIEGDDGEPLVLTPELALAALTDPDQRVLRDGVRYAAGVCGQRRVVQRGDVAGK